MSPAKNLEFGKFYDGMNQSDAGAFVSNTDKDDNNDIFIPIGQFTTIITGLAATCDFILPPVDECAGAIYSIYVRDYTSGTVTVKDYQQHGEADGDAYGWENYTINADKEYLVVYSDGFTWHPLVTTM